MKKIKEILIFIGVLIISYILIQYSHIRFSIADDYLLNNIISGTFGNTYDYQMLYINNILGIILKGLYEIIPRINVYTLYLITTISICYMLIVRDILKHKKNIWIPIVFMLYLLTLYNITYTIIAYLSIAVGILELNLYILDSSTYNSLSMDYKITNRKEIGEYKNIIKAGGGDCFSNRYYSCLERYNLKYKDNLYKNLTENNVFYIGEINDVLRCYLKENVDENADFFEDTKVDGRIIYKFKMFN